MALLGRLIGLCLLPLIFFVAFEQGIALSDFFISACRYMASTRVIRAFLSACYHHLRASQECDIACSYPGSPLILATLFEQEIPTAETELAEYRAELKRAFYNEQWQAGRISFAQQLTFLNRPNAGWYHEKEDAAFAERYQAAMAAYEVPPRPETTREWVRRMREEREAANEEKQQLQGAPHRSREQCSNAHARALALLSDTSPQIPPKFRKLRGLAPRDSKGNIVWGRDPVYEAYLIEQARAKQIPTGIVYRRWDSFALSTNEKIRFKSLKVSDRLNLWSYTLAHRREDIFQIHPPDNRSMLFDMLDQSYHELWEWDYQNNLPLWRIMNLINKTNGGQQTTSHGGGASLFGSGSTGFGVPSRPTGLCTSNVFETNTPASNTGGALGNETSAPAPSQHGSLLGKYSGASLFSDPAQNPATGNSSTPSSNDQPAGSTQTQSKTYSEDNVLATLWVPAAQHAKIREWISDIEATLDTITYEMFRGKTNDPGDAWIGQIESAERWLRWIAEFASDANGKWDSSIMSVTQAKNTGIKSRWWKALGRVLKAINDDAQTDKENSPLAKLYTQFWKVHNLCRETV